jgi:transcriptional regulator with XRE-family HTH domain
MDASATRMSHLKAADEIDGLEVTTANGDRPVSVLPWAPGSSPRGVYWDRVCNVSKGLRKASQAGLLMVGGNVRRLRNVRGYTQAELAKRTGLYKISISDIERGQHNLRLTRLQTIAVGLACSPAALVTNHPDTAHESGDMIRFRDLTLWARSATSVYRSIVADNIKRLRLARGWSQTEFADRSELCKSYLSNVEQGHVNLTLASMEALAQGLQCSLVDILLVPLPCEPHTGNNTTGSNSRGAVFLPSDGYGSACELIQTKGH